MNSTKTEQLNILQINVKSLSKRKDIIEKYIYDKNIHIGILSETWLCGSHSIKFNNYKLITRNRTDGWGGVAILLRDHIKVINIATESYKPLEILEITAQIADKTYNIISIYIPPKTTLPQIEKSFKKLINKYNSKPNVIIGGDINAHNTMWEHDSINDRKGEIIADLISESNLVCLNNGEHTYQHISKNYTSAIDVTIMSTDIAFKSTWNVGENLTSDHFAITIEIKNGNITPNIISTF